MIITYLQTKFHMRNCNFSSVIAIKPKAKYEILAVVIALMNSDIFRRRRAHYHGHTSFQDLI
jgi:hypothetical protein